MTKPPSGGLPKVYAREGQEQDSSGFTPTRSPVFVTVSGPFLSQGWMMQDTNEAERCQRLSASESGYRVPTKLGFFTTKAQGHRDLQINGIREYGPARNDQCKFRNPSCQSLGKSGAYPSVCSVSPWCNCKVWAKLSSPWPKPPESPSVTGQWRQLRCSGPESWSG